MTEPKLIHTTYIDSASPRAQEYRQEWLELHSDGEAILCDAFPGFGSVDNSVSTQQSLIRKGRLSLLRPLYEEY